MVGLRPMTRNGDELATLLTERLGRGPEPTRTEGMRLVFQDER